MLCRLFYLILKDMLNIKTIAHLCLRIKVKQEILIRVASNMDKYCSLREKETKPGKRRLIANAKSELKAIQHKILHNLLYRIPISPYAHGAVPKHSAKTNAAVHCGRQYKFCMDLKSCFPNVPSSRIRRLYEEILGCSPIVAQTLTNLTTFNYELAQGFPTSAALVNILCIPLDKNIYEYVYPKGLRYSRYIDDITISGSFISEKTRANLRQIVTRNAFFLNMKKETFNTGHSAGIVTGLNTDSIKPIVPRQYKKNLRAAEYNLQRQDKTTMAKDALKSSNLSILGKKQYIKAIEG